MFLDKDQLYWYKKIESSRFTEENFFTGESQSVWVKYETKEQLSITQITQTRTVVEPRRKHQRL